jgi:hypothetical protein
MSFADDFDHYIPDMEWMEGGYSSRSYRSSSYVDYNATTSVFYNKIVHETEKAYLVQFDQGKTWIPKSKVVSHIPERLRISIPMWLYRSLSYIKDEPE